jgi:hypothetical protein
LADKKAELMADLKVVLWVEAMALSLAALLGVH